MSEPQSDHSPECPTTDVLARVAAGLAKAFEEAQVQRHLDGCARCRKRFDEAMGPTDDLAALIDGDAPAEDADFDALRAAHFPRFPHVEVRGDRVVVAGGLSLDLPREPKYVASFGSYDVVALVGMGAMGVVLQAVDRTLQRTVALKLMAASRVHDPEARQRFLREARAAAKLKHPNVVTVYSAGIENDMPYIDMEYVEGRSLASRIAEEGRLDPPSALALCRQVLAGLGHAHAHGVIHRDIKPGNVLLEEATGTAKLADFGLARGVAEACQQTMEGTILGSPSYMSPEQAAGLRDLDGRSDLFSVGTMLFEMLVGAVPFAGSDPYVVIRRIREEDPPNACLANPAVPRALGDIVRRAMARQRENRFQTADQFIAAIDTHLAGHDATQPLQAPRVPGQRPGSADPGRASGDASFNRCASCVRPMLSKLSIAGTCDVCGASICSACWHAGKVRRCRAHAATPAGQAFRPDNSARQGAEFGDKGSQAGKPDLQPPAQMTRPAVSAADAALAEETFFRLVENALADVSEVFDPVRRVAMSVGNFSQFRTRQKGEDEAGAAPLSDASRRSASSGPSGDRVVYDVRQRGLWKSTARVVVETLNVLHSGRFAAVGEDDQPVAVQELESLLNRIARRAADEETWRLVILGSPTGWTDEALQTACGAGPRPFRDRLVSVVLYDSDQSRFRWAETDERLARWHAAFSAGVSAAELERARQWIGRRLAEQNSIAAASLAEQLGFTPKAADQVCRILAAEGQYVCEFVKDVGTVLSKNG
jgi:serine/threonine protein kinase